MKQEKLQDNAVESEVDASKIDEDSSQNDNEDKVFIELDEDKRRKRFFGSLQQGFSGTANGIALFFKHPKDAMKLFLKKSTFFVYFIAILSGLVGAAAAWVFGNYIALTRIFFYGLIYNNTPEIMRIVMILLLPTIAAAITAPILLKWAPEAQGHGIPEVMESIIYKDGYIKTATPYLKMGLSGICIGGGLSLGREGPIAQIGGGFSSFLGRKVGLRGRNIKIVVVCGLVAGISATFNAPIGAALFGLEILIVSLHADQLIPIIVSSLIANTIGRLILELGSNPVFEIPEELTQISFGDYLPYLHWFLLLGVFAGLVAVLYTKTFGLIEKLTHKVKSVPKVIWPIAGGLLTGALGLLSPRVPSQDLSFNPTGTKSLFSILNVEGLPRIFGVGYETITALFENEPLTNSWSIFGGGIFIVLLILLLLKILATAFSGGTGNSGGVFAPALLIGATTGYTFAAALNTLIPSLGFTKQDFALFTLVGLAAVFAGSSRAVLTMIFMASEMTHSYYTFIPLMFTCSISYFISKILMKENIYTQKLLIRGINISMAGPSELLEMYKVKDIMTTDVICVPEQMKMREFESLAKTMDHIGYPIINMKGEYKGIVTTSHLKLATNNDKLDITLIESSSDNSYVLYPEETVDQAMSLLYRSDVGRLAVLDDPKTRNLVGIVSNSDVLKCLEMQRTKDLEERKIHDKKLAEMELQMVQKAIKDYPELAEKVKVIRKDKKSPFTEKQLVEFLREARTNLAKENVIEDEYEEYIKQHKKKKIRKKKKNAKKSSSDENI